MADTKKPALIARTLLVLLRVAHAAPRVAFPFNSQVPTVARVNVPYSFQISASTFEPAAENFTYGLLSQPDWLSIDSVTRILTGSPSPGDEGTTTFTLTAADSSGVTGMTCTLIVSSDPAPVLEGDLSTQIAMSANLSNVHPPVVTLLPTIFFRFDFSRSSFIDVIQRKLYYYATLDDHTPLPSWISFDTESLVFSGTAPELAAFPQSWNIDLIASDVSGFSGSSASFSIAISTEQLAFVPQKQNLCLNAGMQVNYTGLQNQLFRNGRKINVSDLVDVEADMPSWLTLDPSTLMIEGTAPNQFEGKNVTVSVTDRFGNTATAIIDFITQIGSVFARQVGTITVNPGQKLVYHFLDSLFTRANLNLEVDVPGSASWMHFDAANRNLEGIAPVSATSSSIQATLIAQASGVPPQIQPFTVEIMSGSITPPASSTGLTTHTSPANNSTAIPHTASLKESGGAKLDTGILVAIIVLSLVAAGLLVLCMILCCRQYRRQGHRHERTKPPSEPIVSGPCMPFNRSDQADPTGYEANLGRYGGKLMTAMPRAGLYSPPQVDVELPLRAREPTSGWRSRMSRISKVSSLGYGGEDCINSDSNIPELGRESQLLQTPHHSFVIPGRMAGTSRRSSESSPTRAALRTLEEKRRSRLHKNTRDESAPRKRYASGKGRHRRRDRRSFGLPAVIASSSLASLSTRATSILSPQPSDFPQPPIVSSGSSLASSTGNDQHSAAKTRTIRLVNTSETWGDDRPIDVKRQSFIRARASSGQPNPLFAHGSRAFSVSTRKTASYVGSMRRLREGKGIIATYSESSSLEPQPRYMRHISCQAPITFPHVISGFHLDAACQSGAARDSSSGYSTTSSSAEEQDLIKQMALPKHQRSWVLPGEASPTPPPLSFARKVQPRSSKENVI